MSQLIRCRVITPYRSGGCNCPIRWNGQRWVHDPELETGVGEPYGDGNAARAKAFHRVHVGAEPRTVEEAERLRRRDPGRAGVVWTCLHTPMPEEAAQLFLYAALRDRPRDLELAERGQWIKRRTPPRPEGRPRVPRRELERVAGLLYRALLSAAAATEPAEQERREALAAWEQIRAEDGRSG